MNSLVNLYDALSEQNNLMFGMIAAHVGLSPEEYEAAKDDFKIVVDYNRALLIKKEREENDLS